VNNFTLSLYAFHLRHTLTDAPDEVASDTKLLWENLVKLGEGSLPFSGLKDLRSKLICYQNGKYDSKLEQGRQTDWLTDSGSLDLGSIDATKKFNINANLQPFLLNDTYAADLTLVPEPSNISISVDELQYFKPSYLLPSHIQASLGQTLWIYGEVDATKDECHKLAYEYVDKLLAGTNFNPVSVNEDKLFGSLLFEYQAADPNEPYSYAKQCQIYVFLNNSNAQTAELAGKSYDWLLNLLCCYHKILYISQEARNCSSEARAIYSDLEKKTEEFSKLMADSQIQLSKLKKLLAQIPQKNLDYARCLRDLQAHHTAITTNISNYGICLKKITDIAGDSPKLWQDFFNRFCQQWQQQIQTDINYLTPAQELFGRMIDTIRGIVETEQAESDRSLENTIQIVGVGLGAGAIVSGVVTQHIDKINQPLSTILPKNPLYASLLLSLLATLFFGCLAWLWTQRNKRTS
jgi:hypothetical protein